MGRLIMWNLVTLDGFFDGPEKWSLDWHDIAWCEELKAESIDQLQSADMLLFGRVTYEGMANYWSTAKGETAKLMNSIPKVVCSTTLDRATTERIVHQWYARPVMFVADIQSALRFYIDKLGFKTKWYQGTVCQVDRGGCEIILCEDPKRRDKARLFVELNRDGIDELRREIVERSIPTRAMWWGYDVIQITDPDGNELLFPLDETNDRKATE